MKFRDHLFSFIPLFLLVPSLNASIPIEIWPHPQETTIRALNGGTLSPVANLKLLDLREFHQSLSIPIVRLHDAPWVNDYVVDIRTIFPHFDADVADSNNYDFRKTDDFLKTILDTGSSVVFRLGESIEHTEKKYYVNPPSDYSKWAEICANIIRHYNCGWANGYELGIKYWEIWNEPDIDSMWTGSHDEFFCFFSTTAKHLKNEFPDVMIGGPALAFPLDDQNTPNEFFSKFLNHLRKERVPLDFFSWHNYNTDPANLLEKVGSVRKALDGFGFSDSEMHLNEWNYIPGNHWEAVYKKECQGDERRKFYQRQSGPEGAAFVASVLIGLQDSPVDVANYYTTTAGFFGIYSDFGSPHKSYYAFKAFAHLLDAKTRLLVSGETHSISVLAAQDTESKETFILLSNFQQSDTIVELNFKELGLQSGASVRRFLIDENNDLDLVDLGKQNKPNSVLVNLTTNSVNLITISFQ